mgnify:CR=1 FL=1
MQGIDSKPASRAGEAEMIETAVFVCSICSDPSTDICVFCTKDTCRNHRCDRCRRCSDCCECDVPLTSPEVIRVVKEEEPIDNRLQVDNLLHTDDGSTD